MTIRTVALLKRKKGMSFAEFDKYWRDVHAPLAADLPGVVRYVQRHVVPQGDADEPDNVFDLDGMVILDYESAEAMDAAWASPAGQKAIDDIDNFLDVNSVVVLDDYVVVDKE
ncbi:EthD domain-containing protein [Gordonia sp. PKS22-38]|uniref:EthD domain-containing protein n=1 Tax=Gordonia prachuapensis TaxID=3115651 RepID=A0ABU7MSS2_9ACTN|nr:EthD domain-containing protein [Gordonia sp. PKS22-38]